MACFSGPNIVDDGLILSFDAASLRSVPKTNILSGWTDYNSNQANYQVIGDYAVKLHSSYNNWVGYFPATVSSTGKYIITFTYYADSDGSSLVLDNDGIHNNVYNTTVTANISPQTYTGSYDVTTTGDIKHYFRRSSGGNIFVTDVSYFKLETTCTDTSGSGNTGTLTNGTSYDNSNVGSFVFDGSNDHISTEVNRGMLGNTLTIVAWYKYTGNSSRTYTAIIGGKDQDGAAGAEFFVGKNAGNTNIGVQDGNYSSNFVTGSNAFDGNWHQIVYTYDNGTGKIYLDGTFKSSGSFTKCNDAEEVMIGTEFEGSGYPFLGNMSQILMYTQVLSATEVKQNFDALRDRYGI